MAIGGSLLSANKNANAAYEQRLAEGSINWSEQYVEVIGVGLPPTQGSAGQQKLLAQRAATADAYRKILELIQGVQVDSETTVRNYIVESDLIRTRVQGVVQGAQRVGEPRYTPDGTVEIRLRLPLFGKLASAFGYQDIVRNQQQQMQSRFPLFLASQSLAGLSWGQPPFQLARCQRFEQPATETNTELPDSASEPDTTPELSETPPEAATIIDSATHSDPVNDSEPHLEPDLSLPEGLSFLATQPEQAFTGLIIDGRGLQMNPSMSPAVNTSQEQIYVGQFPLDIDKVISDGIVVYFPTLREAIHHRRAGAHPLIVKAVGTGSHRVDFIIKPEDAAQIQNFDQRDHFLEKLQVVAVL